MDFSSANEATLAVLIGRFNSHRLPRILALKRSVDRGELLGEFDLHFLERVIRDANHFKQLSQDSPRYQELLVRYISLYSKIIAIALENERQGDRF